MRFSLLALEIANEMQIDDSFYVFWIKIILRLYWKQAFVHSKMLYKTSLNFFFFQISARKLSIYLKNVEGNKRKRQKHLFADSL